MASTKGYVGFMLMAMQASTNPASVPWCDYSQAALHSTCQALHSQSAPSPPSPTPAPSGFAAVPHVAKILGFAGAIPFLALTPQLVHSIPLLPDAWVANAGLLQVAYGASIASFLGGIHWAMAMADYGGMLDNGTYRACTVHVMKWGVDVHHTPDIHPLSYLYHTSNLLHMLVIHTAST